MDKDLQQQAIGDSAVITCRPADLLIDDYQSAKEDFEKAMTENNLMSESSDENVHQALQAVIAAEVKSRNYLLLL